MIGKSTNGATQDCAGEQRRGNGQSAETVEPHRIAVPEILSRQIDALIERTAARLGESSTSVRRAVELSVLKRGVEALEAGLE